MFTLWEPKKNQEFNMGRILSWEKCNTCTLRAKGNPCDFFHCNNYALQYAVKRRTPKNFFDAWRTVYPDRVKQLFTNGFTASIVNQDRSLVFDFVGDFIDACASFPKGMYWRLSYIYGTDVAKGIVLCRMARGYERQHDDFVDLAEVRFFDGVRHQCTVGCYPRCTDSAFRKATQIQGFLNTIKDLWSAHYATANK